MKRTLLLLFIAVTQLVTTTTFAQDAQFRPAVYDKPLPFLISVPNQPDNFRFTTHTVNIKIPGSEADSWTVQKEQQYIEQLFDLIDDKDFVIAQYVDFYYPVSSGLSKAHHILVQNNVENIGLSQFNDASSYNSEKLLGITRLGEFQSLFPRFVTHETFHQWNSFLESAFYWIVDPSRHTGLIEAQTSVFGNYRNNFEHVQDTIYSYRQYNSHGFVGEFEGYLAGLWDAPTNMRTLKNYYHYPELPSQDFGDYFLKQVKADEIDDVSRAEIFSIYGGERIPNFQNADNYYDCVVIVFSRENFLHQNYRKGFHYASRVNEIEEPDSEYLARYDEIYGTLVVPEHPVYGKRQLNPYHASYKTFHLETRLFDDVLSTNDNIENRVVVFPNPTKGKISISMDNLEDLLSAELYNIQGQQLLETNSTEINLGKIPSGIYLLKLKTQFGVITKKIVKQ